MTHLRSRENVQTSVGDEKTRTCMLVLFSFGRVKTDRVDQDKPFIGKHASAATLVHAQLICLQKQKEQTWERVNDEPSTSSCVNV